MTSLIDVPVKKTSAKQASLPETITVSVWEIFLLKSRNNLQSQLDTYALDRNVDAHDRTVTYHFTRFDWDRTLRYLLQKNNVPVIIHGELMVADN